ncbi:carbohydrate ABC transporter permease [Chloroflexi bacterium TSY]|nr:carbohydrate ABC transporter permease [Chloroflexi bacterium TSY]
MIESTTSKFARWIITYPLLIAGSLVMLFPLAWTFSTSLKTAETVTLREIQLIPDPIMWSNYVTIFQEAPMLRYTINSLIIVVAAVFGGLLVCSLAGYAFARIPFPGRNAFFILLLSTMMLPAVVRLIPLFVIFDRLGWVNTFLPLTIPRLLGHDAFYIFLMRQFFRGIPEELSDAARIDGCNDFGIWWRIIIPNSKPVLAAVAIFSFQFAWNDFLSPLIYLGANQDLWTLALGLNAQKGFEGEITSLHKMMVMSIYMIIPVLGIFAVGQQYMIRGVTFSGLKG